MDSAEYIKNIKSKHLNAFGNEGSKTLLIKKPHLRQGEIQFFYPISIRSNRLEIFDRID